MSESFIKLPSVLISSELITPLELRLLSKLIFWSGINKNNHIKFGAEKLGAQIGIGRASCRKALLSLQELSFIKINHRGNLINESFGVSNDIELTLDAGIACLKNGGSLSKHGDLYKKNTGRLNHLNTGNMDLKSTALDLNDSGVDLNDSGHIDDRYIIKQDYNKITRACAHNETGDGAPVLSMPEENRQGSQGGKFEIEKADKILVDSFLKDFQSDLYAYQVGKVDDYFFIRPYKSFQDIFNSKFTAAAQWFEARGVALQMVRYGSHFANEILFEPKKTA